MIDLRSDTVTTPTDEMREAMAHAVVGDDVYGEDPTVNHLEQLGAEMVGKEAGLFVASGTMGNLTAILAHCQRGDEIILGNQAHTFLYEAGGVSSLGGVHTFPVVNQTDGSLLLADIQSAIRADDPHFPRTRLVAIENTQNQCGGVPLSLEYIRSVEGLTKANGLQLHMDGARVFNAAAAYKLTAKSLCDPVDSVTFCLSKGLCAPVGSILCGSKDFINMARRIRKQLGGGMRQAGILAAAGIIALEKMTGRLHEDHKRAQNLASGLAAIPGIRLEHQSPHTNMVFISFSSEIQKQAGQIIHELSEHGIKVGTSKPGMIRLVTHYWIDDEAVESTIQTFADILTTLK